MRSATMSSSIRAAHPTGLTPVDSPVHSQQAEIVERFNGADEPKARSSTRPPRFIEPEAEVETRSRRSP